MNSLSLLLGRDDAELSQKINEIAPQIEVVSVAQLKENPALISKVEIAFDGLRGEDFGRATSLRWLQNSGAGVDHLPLPELEARGVLLTNASGIHARCISEHVFGMLLGLTRGLDFARTGQQKREWKAPDVSGLISLYGQTLGILGAGEIGAQLARVARSFEMKIIGLSRSGAATPEIETVFSPAQKREFLARSQILVNVLPLTEATRGFVGDAEFDALPNGAIVVNAGRGATIDTDALIRALQSGKLRAALLDVTDPEPLPPSHFLWELPNVFLTPHYAGLDPHNRQASAAIFLDNLRLFLENKPLHHRVDIAAGY